MNEEIYTHRLGFSQDGKFLFLTKTAIAFFGPFDTHSCEICFMIMYDWLRGRYNYHQKLFGWDDQIRSRDLMLKLKHRGCNVLITNADHPTVSGQIKTLRQATGG